MLLPQRPQRTPELFVLERRDAVFREQTRDLAESPQSSDLAKNQGTDLQRREAPGQTVATLLDPEGGTPGDEHAHRVDVDEMLELGGPVRQVLDLVEQQERRDSYQGRLVEGLAQDLLREPSAQIQDGLLQLAEPRDLVELNAQDP